MRGLKNERERLLKAQKAYYDKSEENAQVKRDYEEAEERLGSNKKVAKLERARERLIKASFDYQETQIEYHNQIVRCV